MPSTTTTHYDTVVVGAGPSGLTTAAALARAGVRVLVIEKHPGLSVFPKATGLRPRTMEIMRSWGLEDTILRQSQETRLAMAVRPTLAVPGTEVSLGLPSAAELAAVSPSQHRRLLPGPPGGDLAGARPRTRRGGVVRGRTGARAAGCRRREQHGPVGRAR